MNHDPLKAKSPLLIYLDSAHLIDLLQSRRGLDVRAFSEGLARAGARLALSFCTVAETAAPLLARDANTNVMRLLGMLDSLPCRFIADGSIIRLELLEAIAAHSVRREYRKIDPQVKRFDETVPVAGPPATQAFVGLGIAETVWLLWTEEPAIFDGYRSHADEFKRIVVADRSTAQRPVLTDHFPTVVRRNLDLFDLSGKVGSSEELARWIYEDATRCPGSRLLFEAFHRFVANTGHVPRPSDLGDFNHLLCLPYVDAATVDSRTSDYLRQVERAVPGLPSTSIHRELRSLLSSLSEKGRSEIGSAPAV